MRYSTRSSRLVSIQGQQLPSIVTYFPENNDRSSLVSASPETRSGAVEDGIEVVPIERQNSFSAKALTPSQEEKEVVGRSKMDPELGSKSLPGLPISAWYRMQVGHRIMAIICVQLLVLLVMSMILMEVARKRLEQALKAAAISQPIPSSQLPSVALGSFGIRLENAQIERSDCLPRPNESASWACSPGVMELNLLPPTEGQGNLTLASVQYFNLSNGSPFYGEQSFITEPVRLFPLTNGTNQAVKYGFNTTYDRSVFLLQDRLVPDGDTRDLDPNWGDPIKPGEQPWHCVFKGTHIKGVIKIEAAANATSEYITVNGQSITRLPYVVRISEKIKPDSPKPICVQMVMTDDLTLVPINASMHELELDFDTTDMKRQEPDDDTPKCLCSWRVG
ncbi:hypothetical protein K491DRAFT_674807 [Lophiostoma macrostomum CBS 122681]|uniref:DUF7820 domain-containing protein n=1 Tax=Lophiostoma macrostomum CBS 122681 TaxID=1314788 RepID=A0A6A6TNW4_9PLEO|nr:hypothetical protein K491DRAFT_674807 [Lophiostoma macrostomum CBS 122681]